MMSSPPPPLPPKTRRSAVMASSPATPTVSSIGIADRCCTTLVQNSFQSAIGGDKHVVKIRINPDQDTVSAYDNNVQVIQSPFSYPNATNNGGCIRININNNNNNNDNGVVLQDDAMIRADSFMKANHERGNPYFFYGPMCPSNGLISSGQSSPSDTLDSGTCSDLDGSTPPPLPKKKSSSTVTVTVNGGANHKRNCSLTSSGIDVDSDDDGSNISCDSLNSHELNNVIRLDDNENNNIGALLDDESVRRNDTDETPRHLNDVQEEAITPVVTTPAPPPAPKNYNRHPASLSSSPLPDGLLHDIRERTSKPVAPPPSTAMLIKRAAQASNGVDLGNPNVQIVDKQVEERISPVLKATTERLVSPTPSHEETLLKSALVHERTYEDRKRETEDRVKETANRKREEAANKLNAEKNHRVKYEEDKYCKFYLNEQFDPQVAVVKVANEEEETFAGYKDYLDNNRSTSSTIRSAKGTVRGVKNRVRAGIATFLQVNTEKLYKEKEAGKVIVYTTTMGVVRATFHDCLKVKKILRTLMVKYEERDVMSREVQAEIRERMGGDEFTLPQLFVEGQHIGDAETVERLNETGELRKILKPFKSADACITCAVCGGYRLLPCLMCNGSKKSVHRNEFTDEFVALKCMKCDEVGLVKCYAC